MAIEDYIKPVAYHTLGIQEPALSLIKSMSIHSPQRIIEVAQETYEELLVLIGRGLMGVGVRLNEEDKVAEYISHIIIDAAYLHDRLSHCGLVMEPFPYDYLSEKLFPPIVEMISGSNIIQ